MKSYKKFFFAARTGASSHTLLLMHPSAAAYSKNSADVIISNFSRPEILSSGLF